jgi:hypothetical protein
MPIPEAQLQTWSNQGATVTAQATHTSIRNALSSYNWPQGVKYEPYLQGSYRNSTNTRGDSDVDLVAELTSTFYSNLTDDEKSSLGIQRANYGWSDFRRDVIAALIGYYGTQLVDTTGSKSVKVLPAGGRLKADVVIAASYQYYSNRRLEAAGITFWTPGGQQIVNYPKLHYENGASKNSEQQTRSWYKPTVRMYKNARSRVLENKPYLGGRFPSYFIECLLYNVPNHRFGGTYQSDFVDVLNWLHGEFAHGRADNFVCQNGRDYLFGNSTVQWNIADAQALVSELLHLWNGW